MYIVVISTRSTCKTYDFNQANITTLTDGTPGLWKEVDVEAGVRGIANSEGLLAGLRE